ATAAFLWPPPASWKSMWILFWADMTAVLHKSFCLIQEHGQCHVDNYGSHLCSISSKSTFIQISRPLHRLFISIEQNSDMRCDLHVHSTASGMCDTPLLNLVCRESYNRPDDVYARSKQLGMSIVTLTDHDSIEAAESLRRYPDFFVSEEVTCRMPSGTLV